MKNLKILLSALALVLFGSISGCSNTTKSPDISGTIRTSLNQAGLSNVSVSQDRDKGIVTLTGNVPSENDKSRAESIANSIASPQVVANQIAVLPPGLEKDAKAINSDLDAGIDKNLDAILISHKLRDGVHYTVKNGVVTLSGDVNSQATRSEVARLANSVPNVLQVVNSLQVKNQKASSPR
jgi:hyperosmotically inducible protein